MHLTALACGPGAHRLVHALVQRVAADPLTVVGGTSEDITLCGLRLSPDLDALAEVLTPDTLGGGAGRTMHDLLLTLGAAPDWYTVDDATFARAIARNRWLGAGLTPSEVCDRLTADRPDGVRLLPMSDQPVEAHVVVEEGDEARAVHVVEWVARMGARPAPTRITAAGLAHAHPAPGVLDAIRTSDAVILPLTLPVTGLGVLLGLPGVRDALRGTSAPVIGVSPLLLPSRGDEEATLATMNLHFTSRDVGSLVADVLDAVLVPEGEAAGTGLRGVEIVEVPNGTDVDALADLVREVATRPTEGRRGR